MFTKKGLILGSVGLIVVIAIAAAVLFFFYLRELDQPGEATAQYVPDSAQVYISLNLRPGAGQLAKGQDLIDRLQTDDFLDRQDELLEEAEDETGIHLLDDVTEWLGTDVSLVFLNVDYYRPEWVLMAQVGDRDAADDFMEDLVEYLEDELYTEFETDGRRGLDLWVASGEDSYGKLYILGGGTRELALGLTDEYLFVADSADSIEEMVDNIESPPTRSLAESQAFVDAQESLPSDRFMFAFAQVEDSLDVLNEDDNLADEIGEDALEGITDNTPDYVAASASFIDGGMRVDVDSETPSGFFIPSAANHLESAEALPADTLLLLSGTGLDEGWEEFRDAAGEDINEELDEFLEEFEEEIGFDPERDAIELLTGEIAIAVLPSYFGDLLDVGLDVGSGGEGIFEALLLAGVEDEDAIADSLDDLADWMEDQGVDIDQERLGEYEATVASFDDFEGFEPGYVITDDWAVVASNVDSLEEFHDAATGAVENLGSRSEFRNLADTVPEPLHSLLYADLGGVLEMVEDALDDYDREEYRQNVEPFVEQLGSFIAAASITDTRIRLTAAVVLSD